MAGEKLRKHCGKNEDEEVWEWQDSFRQTSSVARQLQKFDLQRGAIL